MKSLPALVLSLGCRIRILTVLVVSLLIAGSVFGQESHLKKLDQMVWITEHYPPFSYIDNKDGQLKGLMVDILLEMWKKVGLRKTTKDILVYPWARGVVNLEDDPQVCLFGMGITKERTKKYKFVISISPGVHGLIAKKIKGYHFSSIESVNKAFSGKRGVIGVVRDDYGEKNFLEQGGNPELLYQVSGGRQLIKMLEIDRLEMIAFGELPAISIMEQENIDISEYEIPIISNELISGFAFNKNVEPAVLIVLQNAMDEVKSEGFADRIMRTYINRLDLSEEN